MIDYSALYDDLTRKLTITRDNIVYKSLLAHSDLKRIVMGLTNKEISALIKFLKIYRGHTR